MCSGRGDEQLRSTGFPIRKSPDRCLVTDSPGLIAGSYVLLRLLVPRHPPCALINLATTDDARVHCAVLKIRAVPELQHQLVAGKDRSDRGIAAKAAVPSGPNSVLGLRNPQDLAFHTASGRTNQPGQLPRPNNQCSTNELATRRCVMCNTALRIWLWALVDIRYKRQLLLRKEVIQPHLPVRLPCYDFVPIAGPTFDGSLP